MPKVEMAPAANSSDQLYRKENLRIRLQCSERQLELMVKSGRVPKPFYMSDRSPRWRKTDIDAWLEKLATDAQSDSEVAS